MGLFRRQNIGELKAKQDVKSLIKELKNGSWEEREEAGKALVEIGNPRVVEALIGALKNRDVTFQNTAINLLSEIGDLEPGAVEALSGALKDRNEYVRREAAEAIDKIRDPRAVDALSKLVHDEYGVVQIKAREALGMIKSSHAYKPYMIQQARRYEFLLRYEEAAKIYEEFDMYEDARRVRELAQKLKIEVRIQDLELLREKIEEITQSRVEVEKLKRDVKTLESSKIMVEMVDTSHQKTVRTEYFLDKLELLEDYTEGLSERLTSELNTFRRFLKEELFEYVDDEHKEDVRRFCRNLLDIWIAEVLR